MTTAELDTPPLSSASLPRRRGARPPRDARRRCSSTVATSDFEPSDHDYRLRHPIVISEEPEIMDMPVGMNGPALSRELERWSATTSANTAPTAPARSRSRCRPARRTRWRRASTGRAVHYALVRAGVPRSRIQVAPYEVGDHAEVAPLRLSYLRVKAVVPKCGVWPDGGLGGLQERRLLQLRMRTAAQPRGHGRPTPPTSSGRSAMTPADGSRRATSSPSTAAAKIRNPTSC